MIIFIVRRNSHTNVSKTNIKNKVFNKSILQVIQEEILPLSLLQEYSR